MMLIGSDQTDHNGLIANNRYQFVISLTGFAGFRISPCGQLAPLLLVLHPAKYFIVARMIEANL